MANQSLATKAVRAKEFGDFQTPPVLAATLTRLLHRLGIRPRSILEPTCGRGAFLAAAVASFPEAAPVVGVDINADHLSAAGIATAHVNGRVELQRADFFKLDWAHVLAKSPGPWLILGNPPWVTSAALGAVDSENVPEKSNFHGRRGIEAITGKSNFDISEWMLLRYLDWLESRPGAIAVLCKTTVARKVLLHAWKKQIPIKSASIYRINALEHFRVSVDACFFVLEVWPDIKMRAYSCNVFQSVDDRASSQTLGFVNGYVVSDVAVFSMHRDLVEPELNYIWRSGVKHDCSKVMELKVVPGGYQNGLGETVNLEEAFLFPMLKSSDIGNGRTRCRGAMLVTQHCVGEDTGRIKTEAPRTWAYLERHAALLEKRGSVIYKNKPAFSVFGVGPYSFAPWKIATSALYKSLKFVRVGPSDKRPVVFDDTVYFLPCWSESEARFIEQMLCSDIAQAILHSMIHWDEKRPVTVEILKRLNLRKLAAALGRERDYSRFIADGPSPPAGRQLPGQSDASLLTEVPVTPTAVAGVQRSTW